MISIAFRVAAAVGLVLFLDRKGAKAFFGEYAITDCNCFFLEQLTDGTTRSTKRPRLMCSTFGDEGIRLEMAACEGKGGAAGDAGDQAETDTESLKTQIFNAFGLGE